MLEEGASVTYTAEYDDRKGKYRAENVYGGIQDAGATRKAGACYDFQEGRCNRGESCKFSHDGPGGGGRP